MKHADTRSSSPAMSGVCCTNTVDCLLVWPSQGMLRTRYFIRDPNQCVTTKAVQFL